MSKLFSLLKATMSGGIQIFNYSGKTERSRRIVPILLAVLVATMMLLSATTMTAELKEDGGEVAILPLYILVTTAVIIMEGVYKSGDLLFKPRDNDALLAMPIKKSTIVFARIIKFYVFELLYCFIFLLPAIIAYAINVSVGPLYYLVALTMMVFVPVIPIVISCVAGLMITAISSRFKHKTFWQVVLSFVTLFVFAIIILMANTTSNIDGKSIVAVSNTISKFYYPAELFPRLVINFDIGQYLIFVLMNLMLVVVVVLLISKFYFKIVTRMNVVKQVESVEVKYSFIRRNQTFAMVKKEINKYFSTPVLLANTAVGLVLFIVAVGAVCLKYDDIVASMTSSVENFPLTMDELRSYIPGVTFAMVAFASLMTFITTTMISLEGKAFNMLKSMPISGKKVVMTKVLAAMLLIVPVTLIGSIVMFIRFQFNFVEMILVLIAVIVLPLVTELIGILIDLKYARFDAESDVVVVKQSAGVLVATFLGLGMVLFTISLAFALVFMVGQTTGLIMMDAIFAIVAALLYFVVAMRGEEKYKKLVA